MNSLCLKSLSKNNGFLVVSSWCVNLAPLSLRRKKESELESNHEPYVF